MTNKKIILALGTGLTLGVTSIVAEANPFHWQKLSQGYQNKLTVMETTTTSSDVTLEDSSKNSEGKCGAGKCSAGQCASAPQQ